MMTSTFERTLKWGATAALALAALWLVFVVYASGMTLWAVGLLAFFSLGFYVYLADIAFAYRYLFPGIAGMLLFAAFPLVYTVHLGFTNYSSNNLLTLERVRGYLLEQTVADEASAMQYALHAEGREFRIVLTPGQDGDGGAPAFVSPPLALLDTKSPAPVAMTTLALGNFQVGQPLPLPDLIRHRDALKPLKLKLPDGQVLSYAGLREFARVQPVWRAEQDGALRLLETGTVYQPNMRTGFFENAAGERMQPGFKVGIGLANYTRMLFDENLRGPFLGIFAWTVTFAALTVAFVLAIGVTLAVVLNWEALRYRTVYRTLLFLPYAVPAFISILVFKGLFNQNFGEINGIINALFGVKPAWFSDPHLAKVMILIVNVWLGYPYIMLLCAGLIKAIPADLYEASSIAGAGPLTNFFRITAPLIIKPLTPLLISAFAYNFNNFVVISLLTDGRPDFLNSKLPAGQTDILVSYTYRIAFQDSGQNFGLAAAISTMIFVLVAVMALVQLRITRVNQEPR
jgi:maltose/maltodextrin transport system permease protein